MSSQLFRLSSVRLVRFRVRALLATAASMLAVLALALPASAAATPVVIPNQGSVLGEGYGQLSVAWQQYTLSQPAATNPLTDQTGQNCAVGQPEHDVFFLVGVFGAGSATRQCSVPAGKALFFPLVNCNWIHTPIGPFPDNYTTVDQVWQQLQSPDPTVGCGPRLQATKLFASVDGVPVTNLDPATTPYYVCAGPQSAGCTAPGFSVTLPDSNIFTPNGALPGGTYYPAVADGFYLLLAPLPRGQHTIRFGGTTPSFSQDITYTLTVD